MAEKQSNKDRLKEITDSIEKGIQELFQSEKYRQYLRTMSRFHKYSVNNTMLIYMQKPDATVVAGFNKWRDQFGRNVLKGEKGIKIIAPTPYKKKIEEAKLDPDTKLPMLDADGKAIMEEKEIKIPMYKPVTVFDVSQTEGKPLPQLAADLTGNVQNYEVFMEAVKRSAPVPVFMENMTGMDGYFDDENQRIAVRTGMSEVQTVCAAIHEIAHSLLHGRDDVGEKYQVIELFEEPALYSNGRIDREKLPEGLYAYDLRGSDDDPRLPVTIQEHVVVNHAATVITATPIDLTDAGYLPLGEDGLNFLGGEQTVKGFLHEQFPEKAKISRNTEEVQAESISYAVCAYFGIETGENSFGYIATWSKDKKLPELKASLETINRTASGLITDIDRHFAEICKERGIERPKEPEYELVTIPPSREAAMAFAADYMVLLENSAAHTDFASVDQIADNICRNDAQSIRDKLENLVEAEDDSGVYHGAVELLEQFNGLFRKEWQAKEEIQDAEKLYMADNEKYIHVQRSDAGIDYAIYDAATAKALDGGVLDDTGQRLSVAALEICKLHHIGDVAPIRLAPLELLNNLQGANEPPLGSGEQITEAAIKPDVADAPSDIPQLEQNYPMPDPSVDFAQMYQFGYTDGNTMLPLSKERAKELFMQDVPVFMLYADSTEEMALDMEDIEAHPGMYGIERNEWDMMRGIDPQAKLQDAEKRFLETTQDTYLIYQIKTDGAYCDFRFEGTEYLKQHGIEIDRSNYDAIYTGKLPAGGDTGKRLDDLFYTFNLDHPADFQGHSLSVSDIVALKQNGVISCHYVDTVGFKEVHGFLQPENYLKNTEMAMEDDYGMIDGIINNGPRKTVAELEEQSKTGTPISLLELAQAVQREDAEKRRTQQPVRREKSGEKPSILAKLKALPVADTKSVKSAPKWSAEREL